MLGALVLWGCGVTIALFTRVRVSVRPVHDGLERHVTHWDHLTWGLATTAATLGLGWALASEFRGRLRLVSWMPVVCLVIVLIAGTWVRATYEPPIG